MPPETSFSILGALKQSAQRGEAFQLFVARYQETILAWCRSRGLQDADAGDLTQKILQKLWHKLRRFELDQNQKFRSWLAAVVRNAVTDYYRKKERQPQPQGGSSAREMLAQVVDSNCQSALGGVEELSRSLAPQINTAEQEAVARVRSRVEERSYRAFYLLSAEDRTVEDIARELGMNKGAVYRAIYRFRDLVKIEYEKICQEREQPSNEVEA